MKNKEIGKFLFLSYRKRSASFVMNLYKSSLTADSKDIHRARLDAKRLFAILELLEIIEKGEFRFIKARKVFIPVYRQAGFLREIQVNYMLLSQYERSEERFPSFLHWLLQSEKKAIRKMVKMVHHLDHSAIATIEEEINNICETTSTCHLNSKTRHFYRKKFQHIGNLLRSSLSMKELHQIRKNLKAVSTIATLIYPMKPEGQLEKLVSALNRTEMVIGDWHDLTVFHAAIAEFLKKRPEMTGSSEAGELKQLQIVIGEKMENLVQYFVPEVQQIIEMKEFRNQG